MVKSTAASKLSHRNDDAIFRKLCGNWRAGSEDAKNYDRIVALRAEARRNPQVREDGRVANYDYLGVLRWYDEDGVDEDGFFCDGESPIPGAFNRDGWRLAFPRYRKSTHRTAYGLDGFDSKGLDQDGFDRAGWNRNGINRYGFRRDGIHTVTGTTLDPDGYNIYNLREGRDREGELDSDVSFALGYLDGPVMKIRRYAGKCGVTVEEVKSRFELAKKKMPELIERFETRGAAVRGQIFAVFANDMQRTIDGKITIEEFWKLHPQMDCETLVRMGKVQDFFCYLAQLICACDIKNVTTINELAKILGTSDPSKMLENLQLIRRFLPVPAKGSAIPTARQIYLWRDYVKKHTNNNLNGLSGLKISYDGGKTYVCITADDVAAAEAKIRERREVVTILTVREEVLEKYKSA